MTIVAWHLCRRSAYRRASCRQRSTGDADDDDAAAAGAAADTAAVDDNPKNADDVAAALAILLARLIDDVKYHAPEIRLAQAWHHLSHSWRYAGLSDAQRTSLFERYSSRPDDAAIASDLLLARLIDDVEHQAPEIRLERAWYHLNNSSRYASLNHAQRTSLFQRFSSRPDALA